MQMLSNLNTDLRCLDPLVKFFFAHSEACSLPLLDQNANA